MKLNNTKLIVIYVSRALQRQFKIVPTETVVIIAKFNFLQTKKNHNNISLQF